LSEKEPAAAQFVADAQLREEKKPSGIPTASTGRERVRGVAQVGALSAEAGSAVARPRTTPRAATRRKNVILRTALS
jgi:hypothetical protein